MRNIRERKKNERPGEKEGNKEEKAKGRKEEEEESEVKGRLCPILTI